MDKCFWDDAVNNIVYLLNRAPSKALDEMILKEAWTRERPSISHL